MKRLTPLLFILLIFFGLESSAAAEGKTLERAIIIFEEGKEAEALKEVDGTILDNYDHIDAASVIATPEALEKLESSSNVKGIEEDILIKTNAQIADWAIPVLQTTSTWQSGYSGKGIKIAVVDSGIAPHPDLKVAGGISMVGYTTSYYDDSGHGTHVAGIIGALDNTIGIKGVAHGASLYSVKVFGKDNTAYLSDVIKGIEWAITNDMDILNLSLGTVEDSPAFKDVIQKANNAGILIFAAAGNQGAFNPTGDIVEYPARYSEVIAVSAVDQSLKRAPFSSGGPAVDIAAPGLGIYSTFTGGSYVRMSGTSMATPYVAGQAALLKEAYPTLSNEQLRTILMRSVKDLGAAGKDPIFGAGLLQAKAYVLPEFGKTATLNPAIRLEVSSLQTNGYEGATKALKALLVLKDGKKVDVTNYAVWASLDPSIATVSKGLVAFQSVGQTKITAAYGQYKIEATINVEINNDSFSDVSASNSWAYEEIEEMHAKGIVTGYLDGTFRPKNPIRRDHVAVMMSRTVQMAEREPFKAFADVPQDYEYFEQIKAVQQSGIFSGNQSGFNPLGILTRAQMAKVLVKAFDLQLSGSHPFPDVKAGHWAEAYVGVLYQTGITTGSDGNFRPEDPVTRAELAVFISRALAYKAETASSQ